MATESTNQDDHYLNTDLDLVSGEDLTELARSFECRNARVLNVRKSEDEVWCATIETNLCGTSPETTISALLDIVETLPGPMKAVWSRCTLREFNIGINCAGIPWAYTQGVSADLIARVAAVRASLGITLYPKSIDDA